VGIRKRLFGKNGLEVTRVGLGGEGALRTYGRTREASAVIEMASAQGINYFDSARAYAGSEGYYGKFWTEHHSQRPYIFQTSKSASRDKEGASRDLIQTLTIMGLDRLDLWQMHDIRTWEDVKSIEGSGGALESFLEAKDTGIVKFIGVTGHHDPMVLEHCVTEWPVDAVLLPVNPLEAILGGFVDSVLSSARDCGSAVIGMKLLGGSHCISQEAGITPELLIRYALSYDINAAIVGCSTPQEVQTLARVGSDFKPMNSEERQTIEDIFRPHARRLAIYRGVL
jgi:predicted aldo/keto reductase-like oxidoreductase